MLVVFVFGGVILLSLNITNNNIIINAIIENNKRIPSVENIWDFLGDLAEMAGEGDRDFLSGVGDLLAVWLTGVGDLSTGITTISEFGVSFWKGFESNALGILRTVGRGDSWFWISGVCWLEWYSISFTTSSAFLVLLL